MKTEEVEYQDPFKERKVVINGLTYWTKIDKKTNRAVYKRKFSASINGVDIRRTTKIWQTSVTKVNAEVEQMRTALRNGGTSKNEKNN